MRPDRPTSRPIASRTLDPALTRLLAVTGTNGKTSTAWFAQQLLEGVGVRAATFGTMGLRIAGESTPKPPNLPGPAGVDFLLEQMALGDADVIVWEAFSSALVSGVLDHLSPEAAALTTLSRDHLDLHDTAADYEAAKARLFDRILPAAGTAILPLDRPEGRRFSSLTANRGIRTLGFGRSPVNAIRLLDTRPVATGSRVEGQLHGSTFRTVLPLFGDAMIDNVFAALGLVTSVIDRPVGAWGSALGALSAPPGRLELVGHVAGARVFVDYAHNPAALASTLGTLREQTTARLHLVFGCGGERDPGKRPEMGRVADRLADRIIVTDDNPRREPPETIRAEIIATCPRASEIADRDEALALAIDAVEAGDILVVAGKGHEQTQTIGDEARPFSDRRVLRRLVLQAGGTLGASDRTASAWTDSRHALSKQTHSTLESSPGAVDPRSAPSNHFRQEPARCPQT